MAVIPYSLEICRGYGLYITAPRAQATDRLPTQSPMKKPGTRAGLSMSDIGEKRALGRLFLDALFGTGLFGRLGSATRALGESCLDFLDGFGFGHALDRRDFAGQPVERGFIQLPLRVRLLGLSFRPIEVAYDLGDGDDIAGIDLGFVFLRPARPHGTLDTCPTLEGLKGTLDQRCFSQLAHADRYDFGGRNPQRHLVLDEIDDKQLELSPRDFLLFNRHDLAHAVGRINDEFVGLKPLSLGSLLIACHSGHDSFTGAFAAAGYFGCGSPVADGAARSMGGPPRFGRLFGSSAHAAGTFLRFMTRFSCHCSRVGCTPSDLEALEPGHRKIRLPKGERTAGNVVPVHFLHI